MTSTAGRTVLHTSGRVLTPASRDATALAVTDATVVWVGQDAPAAALHPDARRVDLDGDWVAPAFVDFLDDRPDAALGVQAPPAVPITSVSAALAAAADGGRAVIAADDDVRAFASGLDVLAARLGGPTVARTTPMVVGLPPAGSESAAALVDLARLGAVLALRPLDEPPADADLVALAGSGLILAATAASASGRRCDPWGAMRALTRVPGGRGLSPRAAFTALTRGARRAAGDRGGEAGTLVPGAPAQIARWRTGELVAAPADNAVQRWSTDPRSGVPPMPDLDGPDPVCVGMLP